MIVNSSIDIVYTGILTRQLRSKKSLKMRQNCGNKILSKGKKLSESSLYRNEMTTCAFPSCRDTVYKTIISEI